MGSTEMCLARIWAFALRRFMPLADSPMSAMAKTTLCGQRSAGTDSVLLRQQPSSYALAVDSPDGRITGWQIFSDASL